MCQNQTACDTNTDNKRGSFGSDHTFRNTALMQFSASWVTFASDLSSSSVWPQVGQEIEVRPGIVSKDQEGKLMCKPIFSKIVSLFAEHNDLQYAAPGGLIGTSTLTRFNPDSSFCATRRRSLFITEKDKICRVWQVAQTTKCLRAGVGTKIDPTLCRADRMVGQVLGAVGALPEIFTELEISYFLLRRLLGVRTEGDKKAAKVRHVWWEM